ncbi:hypothetical protein [Hymenobacter saemangeumensis]
MPRHIANRTTAQLLDDLRHHMTILRVRQRNLGIFFNAQAAARLKSIYESIDRTITELATRSETSTLLTAATELRAAQREYLARKNDVREVREAPNSGFQRAQAELMRCEVQLDPLLGL